MSFPLLAIPLIASSPVAAEAGPIVPVARMAQAVPDAPVTPPAADLPATDPTVRVDPAVAAVVNPPAEAPADEPVDDIIITARKRIAADPVEAINVQSFQAVQAVDKAVVGPVAQTYTKSVPGPLRDGLRNVISNLDEPIVIANYLLQFKPGKAFETLGRLAINTTLGIAGLFDIAKRKPFFLPHRNNSLANTLGYYGVGPGPYFYLPLIGPTTLRDVATRPIDLAIMPAIVGKPFNNMYFTVGKWAIGSIDERARADEEIRARRDNNVDIYAVVRDEYLKSRQAEIDALHSQKYRDRKAAKATPAPAPASAPTPAPAPESVPTPAPQ